MMAAHAHSPHSWCSTRSLKMSWVRKHDAADAVTTCACKDAFSQFTSDR